MKDNVSVGYTTFIKLKLHKNLKSTNHHYEVAFTIHEIVKVNRSHTRSYTFVIGKICKGIYNFQRKDLLVNCIIPVGMRREMLSTIISPINTP